MTHRPDRLWTRDFILWWLGAAGSALGQALAGIALSFLVLKVSGSSGQMGVNLALTLAPMLLSPLAGALADRLPLRLPLMLGNVGRGLIQLAVGWAALQGTVTVEALHLAALLTGLITAFYQPASLGVLPRLVPAAHLPRATGLMQGTNQTLALIGLIGGGALVSHFGSAPALLLDGAAFLLFAALLAFVRFPARPERAERTSVGADLRAGLRYVRSQPLLTLLPLIVLVVNASLAPLEMLLPARMLALGAGAQGFGLFFGALTGGMAAGSLFLAALGPRVNPALLSVLGFAGLGAGFLALSLTGTAGQMYTVAVLTGLALAATNVGISLTFQTRVQPEFYGRVGSLLSMAGVAGMPLTLLALAPVADRVPVAALFAGVGAVCALGALVWAGALRRSPALPAPSAPSYPGA
ncbi:MFS transporter [Deinococcus sp. SDU3-2]|uniref:MFS transporter n=1 Tax=Deinococcus terrestris TaxID=2651870 RepID=A0A7X1NWE7_9DEIO|nr:MFS transporter [Deinococcus terrestris]MPY66629.1 MFS transporter [Deinococcus terrestris]